MTIHFNRYNLCFDKYTECRLSLIHISKGAVLIEGPKWCGKTTTAEEVAASKVLLARTDVKEHFKNLLACLLYTSEQETKIRELYADFNKQKDSREKRREAMEKLTVDISLLLTAEQQTIYKQMTEQRSLRTDALYILWQEWLAVTSNLFGIVA